MAVGGMPYFGRRLAGLIGGAGCGAGGGPVRWRARYLETRGWRPGPALRAVRLAASADVLYQVGGQIERGSRPYLLRRLLPGLPLVMHWAGSDVLHAREALARGRASRTLIEGVRHWAAAPWLAAELRALGVPARWRPHSWVEPPAQLPALPSTFTLLAYLPEGRQAFYGAAVVLAAARALPAARVLVVGARRLDGDVPANVRCLGWVEEMGRVYAEAHVLLRLPEHDGLAFSVQEALAHGRYALWNQPFAEALREDDEDDEDDVANRVRSTAGEARNDLTLYATDVAEAIRQIEALQRRHERGALPLNEAGAAAVRRRFGRERIRAELRAGLLDVIGGAR